MCYAGARLAVALTLFREEHRPLDAILWHKHDEAVGADFDDAGICKRLTAVKENEGVQLDAGAPRHLSIVMPLVKVGDDVSHPEPNEGYVKRSSLRSNTAVPPEKPDDCVNNELTMSW